VPAAEAVCASGDDRDFIFGLRNESARFRTCIKSVADASRRLAETNPLRDLQLMHVLLYKINWFGLSKPSSDTGKV
jgi:hypothetical protein